ncbi:hypothetical protein CCAX7_16680 [Capsulimonas corticalis]|uniref:Uncharacterized protein n=1 Tax=Capsulimonas corticalis TaxID=2219043 RepID=A0A402CYU6_9BACT|nr:hypothetical protein [Capsulimonas corticalis]BDI29617.1 hypothetical protein CCAX7_16680 [Capsulimonas corticalis]
MGIEEMGFDRTQYRKRRRTVDEMGISEMTRALLRYCFQQGAVRGFLYGAAYGAIFCFLLGALFGCLYGLIAGMAAGLLNGVILSAINAIQRNTPREERYFLWTAVYTGPWVTFLSCYLIFRLLISPGFDGPDHPWLEPNFFYDLIPSLIAAFAAWQAARKMEDWYFE